MPRLVAVHETKSAGGLDVVARQVIDNCPASPMRRCRAYIPCVHIADRAAGVRDFSYCIELAEDMMVCLAKTWNLHGADVFDFCKACIQLPLSVGCFVQRR